MIQLHQHSDFSNAPYLDAINRIKDLVHVNFDLGLTGAAITDHEILSGHVRFLNEAMALRKKGESLLLKDPTNPDALRMANFVPILGNEIYLAKEGQSSATHVKGDKFYHLILLAKNRRGWEQLNELSSRAWSRLYKKGIPRRPTYISDLVEIIGKEPGNIICTTACLGSYLGHNFLTQEEGFLDRVDGFIGVLSETFGKDFYFEIQPGQSTEQKKYNNFLVSLSKKHNIEFVVACDAHYPRPDRKAIHSAYLNSDDSERETKDFYEFTYMMSEEEVLEKLLTHLPKDVAETAIKNTRAVGDKVEIYEIKQSPVIPRTPFKNKEKWEKVIHRYDNEFEFLKNFSHSSHEEDKFFLFQIINGLDEFVRIGWANYETALPRINEELEHVWGISEVLGQRMSTYFTTFQAMIGEIWKKSAVGPGRGSAGAFFINYVLEITQIDPIEYDFPAWRSKCKGRGTQ